MSDSKWCDFNDPAMNVRGQIGHPFSAKDEGAQHFESTHKVQVSTGNSYGMPTYQPRDEVTEIIDICGYHWGKQNPFQQNIAEVESPETRTKRLEKESQEWQDGYEAGLEHGAYNRPEKVG